MAVKQEPDLIDENIPGSIPDVVKIEDDPALLDPTKTEGRRLRELLLDIWQTMFYQVKDLVARLTTKADIDPATGKIKTSQLPDTVLGAVQYQGAYNANTNTPALAAASAENKGHYYVTNVAGVSAVNGLEYAVGDWIISDGLTWDKVDNTTAQLVASVFGRTGAITAATGDYNALQITFTPADLNQWGATATNVKEALEILFTKAGAKQDALTFDLTPTLNSPNPVTSDGIKKAIDAVNTGSSSADFSSYTAMDSGESDTDILAVQKASKAKVKWSLARLKAYLYASLGFVKTVNGQNPDATGNIEVSGGGAGGGSWGTITGTLSAQTDLQTALDQKPDFNEAVTLSAEKLAAMTAGEINLFTVQKKADGTADYAAGVQTINKFAPPNLSPLLADSAAGWNGDRITLTGDNTNGLLGRNAQEYFYKRRWYVCESSTDTQAVWLRNAAIDVLDPADGHDAAIIAQLETETGWSNNTKILTVKSAKGDEYTSDTGYVYTCYSNDNKWRRIGEPQTAELYAQNTGNFGTLCNKLAAYDFTASDYDAKADATGWLTNDIKGWQGLHYYNEAQRALYVCVRNDSTKTLWIKR